MNFGEWGVWTSFNRIDEDEAAEAARVAEDAGYGTFWLGGSPRLAQVRRLLEGSEELVVGTSIVNIWAYDPEDLAREFHELEADFPGRVCVGIGVGHPEATSDYKRPLSAMETFLDGIDAAPRPVPADRPLPRAPPPPPAASSPPWRRKCWRPAPAAASARSPTSPRSTTPAGRASRSAPT